MIRLAIVRQRYNPHGGAERFVTRALSALADAGAVDVTLIARQWHDTSGWRIRKIDPPYLTRTRRDRGFAEAAANCFRDYDIVQSHERIPGATIFRAGDGTHATYLEQMSRVTSPIARRLRATSPYHRYVLSAERAMFGHASLRHVVCNSRMVLEDIARRFGLDQDKLALVPNGVDTNVYHPDVVRFRADWRSMHAIPDVAPLLAYVGSGFLRKGVSTALAAITRHPELHLAIAGHDAHLARYRRTAARLGVEARVRFLGVLDDVRPLYGAADAFILPSLYDPFPNACLEAWACGLPVLTSPSCGAAELIQPRKNGWIIDALDANGYANAIAEWLSLRSEWQALRAAARASAEPYTLQRLAGELQSLYARVLA